MFKQLGLIGCGLMGGSFALAMKRAGLVQRVVGFSKSNATSSQALDMGVIDVVAASAVAAAMESDLVLLALPVAATENALEAIRPHLLATTLVMDVGSTKDDVAQAAKRALGDKLGCFVPAHPITGKEVSGVQHADVDLYQGKQVILTPLEQTLPGQLQQAAEVWRAIGCHTAQMTPQAHDAAYAAVSHLPHLLAFAFINTIAAQDQGKTFLSLAGPGFRDFTRIAASEPRMWRDILLANRDEVLAQSKLFRESLLALEKLVETGQADELEESIGQASQRRAHWRISSPKHTS